MKYEPTTSYASKIDPDRMFATAEEAAEHDKTEAITACVVCSPGNCRSVLEGRGPDKLRRAILHLADLIREGETAAEPTQDDFFKAYEEALQDPRSYHPYSSATAEATATRARSIIFSNDNLRSWSMSDAMITAWRVIGLPGEPTAEKIRALRETQ